MTSLLEALTCLSLPLVIRGFVSAGGLGRGGKRRKWFTCVVFILRVCWNLSSNCIASFIGSTVRRGNVGPMGERVRNLGLGAGSYFTGRLSYSRSASRVGVGDPAEWGKDGRVRSLDPGDAKPPSRGLERRSPRRAPQPRAHAVAPHRSCSGGNFLSLQLSEASPCPLLVSILSVAHGLGAPVRGLAISHRLASLLP